MVGVAYSPTLTQDKVLPVLPELELNLTVNQVFGWLKGGR